MTYLPQPPLPLGHGSVVNDRFEIRQSLGKGGMGEVFLAYDRAAQQAVALKVVREETRMPGDAQLWQSNSVAPPSSLYPGGTSCPLRPGRKT